MKHYKTVLIDFDGTLLDTSIMPQYSANVRQYKRYSPEWHQARKEMLADPDHPCITSPLQIIYILERTAMEV